MKSNLLKYSVILLITLTGLIFFLLFSRPGNLFLLNRAFNHISESDNAQWKDQFGTLWEGMIYENLEIPNVKYFPYPNVLKIQKLTVDLQGFSLKSLDIKIENARITMPDSDPIVIIGQLHGGMLDFNLFSKSVTVRQINDFREKTLFHNTNGEINDVDLFLKGSIDQPLLTGSFFIKDMQKNGFSIKKSDCFLDLEFETSRKFAMNGFATFEHGEVAGKKTALILIEKGKIGFFDNPQNPTLDISAKANIDKTKIYIALTGNFLNPKLELKSTPSLPEERLLVMLATNQKWKSLDKSIESKKLTANVAKDFLSYFLFNRNDNQFLKKIGITDVSVTFEEGKKGLGIEKKVTDDLNATYQYEQTTSNGSQSETSQKIGGEYSVTDNLSIEATKETKSSLPETTTNEPVQKTDNQILLKFKKAF